MLDKCKRCEYRCRPNHVYPCSECIAKQLKEKPVTCGDCKYAWGCAKRGKHERRLRTCGEFVWS